MPILKQAEQWPLRMAEKTLMVPTDEVASYFLNTPPPSDYASSQRYPNLPEDIAQNGVQAPLTIASDGTWAHLEDGYHRAAEAQRQGITELPVTIKGYDGPQSGLSMSTQYPQDKRINPVGPAVQKWFEGRWGVSPRSEEYDTPEHQFRVKMHRQGLESLRKYRQQQGIVGEQHD